MGTYGRHENSVKTFSAGQLQSLQTEYSVRVFIECSGESSRDVYEQRDSHNQLSDECSKIGTCSHNRLKIVQIFLIFENLLTEVHTARGQRWSDRWVNLLHMSVSFLSPF